MAKSKKAATSELNKLNETGRRKEEKNLPEGVSDRRKTKRRRQIDPTTCEREYDESEIEFMHALDEYKRASGRMFPTCSEILEVIVGLGYRQVAEKAEGFSFENDGKSENEEAAEDLEIEAELNV